MVYPVASWHVSRFPNVVEILEIELIRLETTGFFPSNFDEIRKLEGTDSTIFG